MAKMFAVVAIVACLFFQQDSFATSFDPGPPPLLENFAVSDEVFSGTVDSIEDSSPQERGNSLATLKIKNVWKGPLTPGSSIKVSYNKSCPFLVRERDCIRHTLNLKPGILYAFFTRGNPNRFTARAFGTQEYENIAFVLDRLNGEFSMEWLMAVEGKVHVSNQDLFIASVLIQQESDATPAPREIPLTTFETVSLRIEKVLVGERKQGDVIQLNAKVIIGDRSYGRDKGRFQKMQEKLLLSPEESNNRLWIEDSNTIRLSEVDDGARRIRAEFEAGLPKLQARKQASDNVGRISASRHLSDLLPKLPAFLLNFEIRIGSAWNPDPDAVDY